MRLLILAILGIQIHCLLAQHAWTRVTSACVGKSSSIDCTSTNSDFGNTIVLDRVIKGVKADASAGCVYTDGDCYEETTEAICVVNNQRCTFVLFAGALESCSKQRYDYFQTQYSCVPENFPGNRDTYDVCATQVDLTGDFGFITSPGYPSYTLTPNQCVTKLVAPIGKSFKIWVTKIKIKTASEGCTDYLKISDASGIIETCGSQSISRQLCSNEVYIAYRAETASTIFTGYTGFKLYYEVSDVDASLNCTPGTAAYPTEPTKTTMSTTTSTRTTIPTTTYPLTYLVATVPDKFKLCKGESMSFVPPTPYHVFYLEDFNYGISTSTDKCPDLSSISCMASEASQCTMASKCNISYTSNVVLPQCADQSPSYLFGTYRYIPIDSLSKGVACQNSQIDGDIAPQGVITSRNYPQFEKNISCQMTLKVSDPGKVFRIYVTDLYIDPPNFVSEAESRCEQSYVRFFDRGTSKTFCNFMTNSRIYSYTSCTNQVTLSYKTSYINVNVYKGFRAYYEVIDKQFECVETTVTSSTRTTTNPGSSPSPFSSIMTTDNQRCRLPFVYNQSSHENCIDADHTSYWCSVSGDADADGQKTQCRLGLTENVDVSICTLTNKKISCPKNYLIWVASAEYVVTEEKSCDGTPICTSATPVTSTTCSGKNSCTVIASGPAIPTCQNRNSDFLRFRFTCVPDNVLGFKTSDVCGTDMVLDSKGFLTSPGFPSNIPTLECLDREFTFGSKAQHKSVTVYVVSFSVGTSPTLGRCPNSFVQINDGEKLCGFTRTSIVYKGCTNSLKLSLNVSQVTTTGFKFYYEVDQESSCDPNASTTASLGVTDLATETSWASSEATITALEQTASSTGQTDLSTDRKESTATEGASPSIATSEATSIDYSSSQSASATASGASETSTDIGGQTEATSLEATSEGQTEATSETSDFTTSADASIITGSSAGSESSTDANASTGSDASTGDYTSTGGDASTSESWESTEPSETLGFTSASSIAPLSETTEAQEATRPSSTRSTSTLKTDTTPITTSSDKLSLATYMIIIIPAIVCSILTGLLVFVLVKCCCTKKNRVSPSKQRNTDVEMDYY